jgi:hypothetical protein
MLAPNGPVALANVLGREKIPDPTIEPTTIAVSANSVSFFADPSPAFEAIVILPPPAAYVSYGHKSRSRAKSNRAQCSSCLGHLPRILNYLAVGTRGGPSIITDFLIDV